MAADFKSHILMRDEKGFAGVPFKRLLVGAVGGGLLYTLFRLLVPDWAIPIGIAAGVALILLNAPRGGLPLWMRLGLHLRGVLLLNAAANPTRFGGELARSLHLPMHLTVLDGAQVFAAPAGLVEVDLGEWVTFARPRDLDRGDGLVFVASPLESTALEDAE